MDQGTAPSSFYLTLCLYVSFYFLFFTTTTLSHLDIPTDQELNENRRAKSYSEQLDPFLAATRQAQASRQAKDIAKARAKATFDTVKGRHHHRNGSSSHYAHSRQHSKNPSSTSSSYRFSSHSRQHSRQKSHHSTNEGNVLGDIPGNYFKPSFIKTTTASTRNAVTNSVDIDLDVLQHHHSRENTRQYHHRQILPHLFIQQQLQKQLKADEALLTSPLRPQRYKPPQKLLPTGRFPRLNSNRYYHFDPEASLFHKQKMTVPQTTPTSALPSVATATSTTDKSGSNSSHTNSGPIKPGALSPTTTPTPTTTTTTNQITSWNVVPTPTLASTEPQLESLTTPQKHTSSIGWADVKQGAGPTLNNRILSEPSSSSSEGSQRQQMAVQTTMPEFSRQGHAPGDNGVGTSQTTSSSSANRQHERQSHLEESVSPATLLAHLRLLRLVQSLVIIEDEDLDFLFLIRSEERYMMYLDLLEQLQPPADAVPLPPLDVALMWTVHMLAPFRYHEDLVRSYSPHLLNYTFPLERYVASVDIEDPATIHEAFGPSKEMWHQLYPEEAFDLDKNDTNQMFEIRCLWCGGTNVMDSSTYIKFRIDGVAIDCAGCGSQCSLETLSSKRLWDSVEAYRANSSVLLAGSLLSPWTGTPDTVAAQREHHHLFFHPRIQFALDQASVSLNCTWPKVIQAFQDLGPDQYYGIRPTTLARIMSSYMGLVEDRLSMDLVAGALRQRDFQKAMMVTGGLAWCQPQVLHRSLERYKKFMLLARAESKHTSGGGGVAGVTMTAPGGGNLGAGQPGRHALVPTLDIDLAWHTHMLSPDHYRQYQLAHFGCVLNHDDTVQATSTMTKQDFVRTAELWQALYQERYSSQQLGKSRFVMTPKKLWAGICFPPYGAYLAWKSWKSKRKAKKLNKAGASMTGSGWGSESKSEKGKKLKEKKKSKKEHARDQEKGSAANAGDETASKKRKGKSVKKSEKIDGLTVQHESPVQRPSAIDLKGKSKADNGTEGIPSVQGAETATSTENLNKNMAPGLGLDGRLSNWNGDAAGPDGQASCASGACIMSPWNELQELVPYIDLQPQQQRELRRERT